MTTNLPTFDPDADGPGYRYLQLADYLTARITEGTYPYGARLPGERLLSDTYLVSLGTARRATDILVERGLVRRLPAKGTYIVYTSDPT